MFCAHIGAGLLGKKFSAKVPIGGLVVVAFLPDILGLPAVVFPDANLDLVPWTHGLSMCVIWAAMAGLVATWITHELRDGVVVGLLVLSHWVLDFISWPLLFTGRLPLFFSESPEVGLGLYSSVAGSIVGEIVGLLFAGVMVYTLARGKMRR